MPRARFASSCRLFALALTFAVLLCGEAAAHSHKQKGLEIVHPWCFATSGSAANTAVVSMLVKNGNRRPDRLLRAKASIAGKTELRTGDGMPARGAFVVNGRSELILRASGARIVLSSLKRSLEAYDAFHMTLVFEKAGKIEVEVQVEEAPATPPPTQ